jgi:ADP-ribosylglycohydrolase
MLGAIAGDIIGSVHEFAPFKSEEFPLFVDESEFTDDSVLTVAVADCLLSGASYVDKLHEYTNAYPHCGYGARFWSWVNRGDREPYNSWGNGSAMRVSPVAYAFETLDEVLAEARRSAEVTHNHLEGVKGAQATATAVFLARKGSSKTEIREAVQTRFGYNLKRTVAEIRPAYLFNESCQETVPEAIIAFLDSENYEHAVRLAVSLGGDADTLACITGGIAEAFYMGVPEEIAETDWESLDKRLRRVVATFYERFKIPFFLPRS